MFIITIIYKKPINEIEAHIDDHRAFIDDGYKNNYFMMSGPQNPRTGGIIISHMKDKEQLEQLLKKDPFLIYDLANYQITEFQPNKYHQKLSEFI